MSDEKKVSGDSNVVAFAPKKKKGRPKEGLSKAEIQFGLLNWVTGEIPFIGDFEFQNEFRAYYSDYKKGIVELIKVKDGKATITNSDELFAEIWRQMWNLGPAYSGYKTETKEVEAVVRLFKKTRHKLFLNKAPEVFCWDSEKDKLAFNRLVDPPKLDHFWPSPEFIHRAPLYSDFISRCQYPNEVRQFLGSFLDICADRKIILWNWGEANAGKTTFFSTLLDGIFGEDGFTTLEVDPDRFMKEGLVNKLAVLGDEIHPDFIKSLLFKQLTGGSKQRINGKGTKAVDGHLKCKFIFCSNSLPEIPRESGQTARILFNHIKNIAPDKQLRETDLKRLLAIEFPFILADIRHAYEALEGKKIQIPEKNHESSIAAYDLPYQMLFDQLFEVIEPDPEWNIEFCGITSAEFGAALRPHLNHRELTQRRFIDFVKAKYGIKVGKQIWDEKTKTNRRIVPGLQLRRKS